jgi:hypothetical protein
VLSQRFQNYIAGGTLAAREKKIEKPEIIKDFLN